MDRVENLAARHVIQATFNNKKIFHKNCSIVQRLKFNIFEC